MNRYLLRLLTFSLVLGVIPVVLLGVLSYTIAAGDIEQKVKEGKMQWLAQTQQRVEQLMKSIDKSATQFANSAMVSRAMNTAYGPGDFEAVRDLSAGLYNLQSSDVVITQAYVVNLEKKWAVSLNSIKPLEALQNYVEILAYSKEPKSIRWYTGSGTDGGDTDDAADDGADSAAQTLTLVHKIPILPMTDQPQGLVIVKLAAADIRAAVASPEPANRNYILNGSGTDILGSPDTELSYREINRAVMQQLQAEPGKEQGLLHTRIDGKEAAVLYRPSSYNDWTYVSVIALAEITGEARKIAAITAILCAVILTAVLAAALYGSRRMYRPIRHLLDTAMGLGPAGKEPAAASLPKDELEYIRTSMQSLATVKDRMDRQMREQMVHLREFYVLKLFTGQMTESTDGYHQLGRYGFPADWRSLGVLALQIDNLQETRYQEEDRELLMYAINNMAQELIPAQHRFTPIFLNQTQLTLIVTEAEEPEQARRMLDEWARRLKDKVEQYLQLQVSIGISRPYTRLPDTVKAYGECLSALKSRISLGPDIVVHFGDTQDDSDAAFTETSHLKVLEERLIHALREMQLSGADEAFAQYLDALLYKEGSLHKHQMLLIQLISRLLELLQEQGIAPARIVKDEGAVQKLFQLQTREEIIHWFSSRWFAPLIQVLSEKSQVQYVTIANRLVRMIQEQYDRKITLESCAQTLNYHPVYVSRIFKREIGMTFSEYLSDYRMKMAKVLLETTDKKISEIGEHLQYKNISAFIRSFRKMYDMTPGQYRENLTRGSFE